MKKEKNNNKNLTIFLAVLNFVFMSAIQKDMYWDLNIFMVAIFVVIYCCLVIVVSLIPSFIYFAIRKRKRAFWEKGVAVMLVATLFTSLGLLGTFANTGIESIASTIFSIYVIALIILIATDKDKNAKKSSKTPDSSTL